MDDRAVIVKAYKRIRDAAESGRGVKLSANECAAIWFTDDAVSRAVSSYDDPEQWPTTTDNPGGE